MTSRTNKNLASSGNAVPFLGPANWIPQIVVVLLFLVLINGGLYAQSEGDYRSGGSGDWDNRNTWERYDGSAWVDPAPDYPGQNTGTGMVTILSTHNVRLNTNPGAIGELIIEGGYLYPSNSNRTLTINGNLTVSSGTLSLSNNNSRVTTLNLGGNFIMTGGTITETANAYGTVIFNSGTTQTYTKTGGTISNTINFTVTDGTTLDVGTSIISGGGTFNLNSGTTLITANTNGIASSGATGSIQTTTRTFNSDGYYVYNGSAAQITGTGLPLTVNGGLTINNSSGVTLSQNTTVAGTYTPTAGALTISSNYTLTLSGTTSCGTSGSIYATNGTVNYGTSASYIISGTYYNLTKSGAGTSSLCGNVIVNNILTLNTGIIQLNDFDLTLGLSGSLSGSFSATNMVETNGTGYFIKQATTNAGLRITYPVGSGGYYSPMTVSSITATFSGTGSIAVRAVSGYIGSGILSKYWDISTNNLSGISANPAFTYDDPSEINGSESAYSVWFSPSAGNWQAPDNPTINITANTFGSSSTSILTGRWTAGSSQPTDPVTYYSFQTGDWNTADTWTTDPSGTTLVGSAVPANGDVAIILSGRIVSLTSDISSNDLKITIISGGFLNMATYAFTAGLGSLEGQGTLQLASASYPVVTSNGFVEAGGGTTEYKNTTNFTLSTTQTTYNHLTINTSAGVIATQLNNLTLNGNLHIKQGTYRINDNSSGISAKRNLIIYGNVTVNNGASVSVGNGSTNTTADPTSFSGGTAPYLNYYEAFHRVVIYGDFTNNGTVKFTNLAAPNYSALPPTGSGATSGAASVYFMGSTSNTLFCNGTTDFYNLILDKGSDQTYSITVEPTAYEYFRLFGANTATATVSVADPDLMKALWIRTGTLILKGLTAIPSLTEGSASGSEYCIPASGALKLDGPDVIVLNTADDNGEANIAYNVSGTSGVNTSGAAYQGLFVYGTLEVNGGYLSMRESAGLLYNEVSSGEILFNGGVVDAKQFRTSTGTASGTAYRQNGGTFVLRGRFVRPIAYGSISDLTSTSATLTSRAISGTDNKYATFNLNDATNIFQMTGGTVKIYDASGDFSGAGPQFAIDIISSGSNSSVSGGTFEILPQTGSGLADVSRLLLWNNEAFYGNVIINRGSGCTTTVQLRNRALTVLNDLTITSGVFEANDQDVTIGGDFTIGSSGTYNSGVTGTTATTNTTTFNGNTRQVFTIDGNVLNNASTGLLNLVIDNPADTLRLNGTQTSLTVQGTFDLTQGTFDDDGKTVFIAGNITNFGIHTGSGKLQLNGTATQTISGSGSGIFENIELNNSNAASAPVSLTANVTINGEVTFTADKSLDIGSFNVQLNPTASIINAGTGTYRYFKSNGEAGDGGLTYSYPSSASFTFPLGAPSTGHAAAAYTPATIGFTGTVTSPGSITVVPVGYEHPATTTNGLSLTYFWRVKTNGFSLGSATVNHSYSYNNSDIPAGTTESEYIAARYNSSSYVWTKDGSINTGSNTISFTGINTISGDFTAGDNVPTDPFGTPKVYYSLASGLWSSNSTWTFNSSHTGVQAGSTPGSNDIVVIGNNHTIALYNNTAYPLNSASVSCASLQIDAGSTLDIGNNSSSVFSMVVNNEAGNGTFRLTTTKATSSVNNDISTFIFPAGDFSDFEVNQGTEEFYTTTSDGNALYILPQKSSFGNVVLSPLGTSSQGDNMVLPNVSSVSIYGDLTINGATRFSAIGLSWNTNNSFYSYSSLYTTVEKTVHIVGNVVINGGSFTFFDDDFAQHLIVDNNVTVNSTNGANIIVWDRSFGYTPYNDGPTLTNTFTIGGSLYNYGVDNGVFDGVYLNSASHYVDVTFQGSTSTYISGTGNTTFHNVIVNKGTSQATTLTCDVGGTLATPTDNWFTLQNGTFMYKRTEPSSDFTISVNTPFTIPTTAGLYIDYTSSSNRSVLIANTNNSVQGETSDVYLDGKLTLINGNVYIGQNGGSNDINNDIEYSGSGASEIDIQGGYLMVNGQIRRSPSSSGGVLKYSQTNGSVVINGEDANATNAKFEVLNTGSSFTMTGGTLTLVRGGGTSAYGDLYLRPETSSVTGGTISLQPINDIDTGDEIFTIDASIALNNLTITGFDADDAARASLSVNPLVLNGNLSFSNVNSYLTTNNLDVSIKGNLTNDGATANYICGTNQTLFNGITQLVTGTAATNFYNLKVNPLTNLTLSYDVTVTGNLTLTSGTLICGNKAVHVKGNIANNATYTDTQYGVVLDGTAGQQEISGTGTFGRFELNNASGAVLLNNISLNKNLALTFGVLNIDQYMLSLGENSLIEGSGFGTSKMIETNGVFSGQGVSKIFTSAGSSFTFPIGVSGKYTPATLAITAIGSNASVRINNINSHHPAVIDAGNVLQYYWEMEGSGINNFTGNVVFNYLEGDVSGGPETDYLAARLITPGTSWSKTSTVDDAANTITFSFTTTDNLSGEYTAGIDAAFPDNVPVFTTIFNGDWNDPTIWSQTAGDPYTLSGGPNGFIVIINDTVEADANYCQAYRTAINGQLSMISPYYGHNLGTVTGSGTLYLESGNLPAGRYTDFLTCSNDATLEYGGTGNYIFLADLFNTVPNLILSGTGSRIQPNKDLTICHLMEINGPTYDNSVNNRMLTILGALVRTSGAFYSGTGATATVVFAGSTGQTVSDFSGTNSFNNFEIDNSAGLTLGGPIDITGNLLLTDGLINTTASNVLTIENTSITCVTPTGGSSTSYISGPLIKKLNQANDYFQFPVGNASSLGNHLSLRYTETGTKYWTVEYVNPHSLTGLSGDLTAVNEDEYWNVSTPGSGRAIVNIKWIPSSNLTPLMTEFGISDMRVAEYDDGNAYWVELASTQSGNNYNGSAETTSKINLTSGTAGKYTLSCVNQTKPRIRLDNSSPVCGDAGIPVILSTSYTIYADYTISYTLNGATQTPLTVSSFPAIIPTISTGGTYQLTGFTYNNPAGTVRTGAVDVTVVTTYAVPTLANAGNNQSLCGSTSATLDANGPYIGTGLWSIISGTGGTVITPTDSLSDFSGTNGTTYTLRWTITNGTCVSSDDVVISFPLLAEQPENFTSSSSNVCQEQNGVAYTVPNDPSVTYSWTYTGTGYTINGSDNSVTIDFDATATSGSLSVTATNTCGTSDPRTINLTVNPLPTITLDPASAEVCRGASSAELVYTGTTNSPSQYSINYEAGAEAQGFTDITNAALGSSPLTLVVPVTATASIYNASLTVRNSTTGCISHDNSFTITVHALPVPAITGSDTTCVGSVELYDTETGMTNYVWNITSGSGTITPPGDTYEATVTWGAVTGQYQDRTISVNYTDANGCSASTPTGLTIRVFKVAETGPAYYIPNE